MFDFEKISSIVPPCDLSFPKRKEWLKKLYLEFVDSAQAHTRYFGVYAALASLLNDEKVDEELIFAGIDYINRRYDCSDFCMHGLILYVPYLPHMPLTE